jgi:hypothetical protein
MSVSMEHCLSQCKLLVNGLRLQHALPNNAVLLIAQQILDAAVSAAWS